MLIDIYWVLWDFFIWWVLAPVIGLLVIAGVVEVFIDKSKGSK